MLATAFLVGVIEVDRRRLVFQVSANDVVDTISTRIHERFVIAAAKFEMAAQSKR